MLNKLALAGIKNRFRDYAVLFSGLIIGSAIFYMFMTIATNKDFQAGSTAGFSATPIIFMFGAILLMIITFVYVVYANSFLLSMRKRDYATFMMLGAKSSKISHLIFTETMIIGSAATVCGIIIGIGMTQLVGGLLMKSLDAATNHFAPFYLPAVIVTLVFFIVLFFFAALVNAGKMRATPILTLLRSDSTPSRIKMKPFMLVLAAVAGIVLLAIGYWAMRSLSMLGIMAIPLALVTIVLGSYFLFNAVVVVAIQLLKANRKFAGKGLRNFTLAQISFRVRSYTAILSIVSILFALALGAITVGLNFYNEVPHMAQNFSSYDLVQHNPSANQRAAVDKMTGVYGKAAYTVKVDKSMVTFNQADIIKHPLIHANTTTANGGVQMQHVQLSAADFSKNPLKYTDLINALLTHNLETTNAKAQVASGAAFAQAPGTTERIYVYRVHDLRANIKTLTKLQSVENKKYPSLVERGANGSVAASYAVFNAMFSGFAFMGFFLGLAFLAMLASTLMFKILSGADYDKTRYAMLRKIGVRERLLRGSIRSELLVLFALPGILGVVHVLFGLQLFKTLLLNPYDNLLLPFGVFGVLYLIYFLITVWLYNGIVLRKDN
ncbi:FtsX-like permease family protein [Lacticaseibacillus sharpeae]|uniref:Peptide ABC transporter permease n=1 Tax=Lacticaseibacillus sharpeae JCM 1186 = DSM 20505 TaxID=1291052 RepID=A0A0R1ZMF8_9LACO|nr:FtsX-like permease family protein [Lacticaseibacillus sharpeae]KRM56173.1 peptide ABC transporter permease [Lacticaseibacillus sharpeae JCM 1186 = DSM 20505]